MIGLPQCDKASCSKIGCIIEIGMVAVESPIEVIRRNLTLPNSRKHTPHAELTTNCLFSEWNPYLYRDTHGAATNIKAKHIARKKSCKKKGKFRRKQGRRYFAHSLNLVLYDEKKKLLMLPVPLVFRFFREPP